MHPNFSYNWLYVEVDGVIINNIYNTTEYPEVDTDFFIASMFDGRYIHYNLDLTPDQHQINFKGNGSIDYRIISSSDWDEDFISDLSEVRENDLRFDPTKPMVWSYFEKGDTLHYMTNYQNETVMFRCYVPETYTGSRYIDLVLENGEMSDIKIDDDVLLFKDETLTADYLSYSCSRFVKKVSSGFHFITYKFTDDTFMKLTFLIDGKEIVILDKFDSLDSDADGLKNPKERSSGLDAE